VDVSLALEKQMDGEKLGKRQKQKLKAAERERLQQREGVEEGSVGYRKKKEKEEKAAVEARNLEIRSTLAKSSDAHTTRVLKGRAEERAEAASRR
jgi:hypothetical protein